MLRKVRRHGLDHRNFIYHFFLGQVGEEIGNPGSALPSLLEFPRALEDFPDRVELSRRKFAYDLPRILPVVLRESRFVVEGVHLRRPAVHVEENDVLCPSFKMTRFRSERINVFGCLLSGNGLHGNTAKTHGACLKHGSSAKVRTGTKISAMHDLDSTLGK